MCIAAASRTTKIVRPPPRRITQQVQKVACSHRRNDRDCARERASRTERQRSPNLRRWLIRYRHTTNSAPDCHHHNPDGDLHCATPSPRRGIPDQQIAPSKGLRLNMMTAKNRLRSPSSLITGSVQRRPSVQPSSASVQLGCLISEACSNRSEKYLAMYSDEALSSCGWQGISIDEYAIATVFPVHLARYLKYEVSTLLSDSP